MMGGPTLRGFIKVGLDVLRTTLTEKKNAILAYVGNAYGNTGDADNVEWWQHIGFASRPSKPTTASGELAADTKAQRIGAQAITISQGYGDVAIASRDVRSLKVYGQLKEGETAVFAAGEDGKGQARTLWKADGSIHHYTRVGNAEDGAGMVIQIDPQNNAIRLLNGDGCGLIIEGKNIYLTNGEAALTLTPSGDAKLIGKGQAQVDGKNILLGSQGVPGPNSALMGPTGISGAANPKIIMGT